MTTEFNRPKELEFLGRLWRRYESHAGDGATSWRYRSGTFRMVENRCASGRWSVSLYCTRGSLPAFRRTGDGPSGCRRSILALLRRCGRLADE